MPLYISTGRERIKENKRAIVSVVKIRYLPITIIMIILLRFI